MDCPCTYHLTYHIGCRILEVSRGIGPRQIREIGTMDCHACHEKIEDGGVEVQTTYRLDDLRKIDRVIICEGCFGDGVGDDIPPLQRGVC